MRLRPVLAVEMQMAKSPHAHICILGRAFLRPGSARSASSLANCSPRFGSLGASSAEGSTSKPLNGSVIPPAADMC